MGNKNSSENEVQKRELTEVSNLKNIILIHNMEFLSHKQKWLYHTGYLLHRFLKKL